MKSLISKRALFETESNGEFLKGDSVQLGDGSKGTVVDKVEREGFAGYRVEITNSEDEDQIGNVVGATSQGMKKAFQSLTQSLRNEILAVGDDVQNRVGTTGKITNIEINAEGNKEFVFLPKEGGMRQKATADKLIRLGMVVGTEVIIPKGTSFETEGVGSEYYDADIDGTVVEDLGEGLLVVETNDGNEILMTDYEVMSRAAYSRHYAASKQSGRVPSFNPKVHGIRTNKHVRSDFGKKAQFEIGDKVEWDLGTVRGPITGTVTGYKYSEGLGEDVVIVEDDDYGEVQNLQAEWLTKVGSGAGSSQGFSDGGMLRTIHPSFPLTSSLRKQGQSKYSIGDKVKYNSPVGNDMSGTIVDQREMPQDESEIGGYKYVVLDDDMGMEVDDIRESDIIEKVGKHAQDLSHPDVEIGNEYVIPAGTEIRDEASGAWEPLTQDITGSVTGIYGARYFGGDNTITLDTDRGEVIVEAWELRGASRHARKAQFDLQIGETVHYNKDYMVIVDKVGDDLVLQEVDVNDPEEGPLLGSPQVTVPESEFKFARKVQAQIQVGDKYKIELPSTDYVYTITRVDPTAYGGVLDYKVLDAAQGDMSEQYNRPIEEFLQRIEQMGGKKVSGMGEANIEIEGQEDTCGPDYCTIPMPTTTRERKIHRRVRAAAFETWLMTFLDEKGIGLQEFLTEDVQVGDVVQGAFMAPPNEQGQIKDTLVKIDFAYGDVRDFLRHLAQAPGLVDRVTKLHMGGSKRVGQSMYAFWSTLGPIHRYNLHVVNEDTDELVDSGGGSTDEEALRWLKTNYPSVMDIRTERIGKKAQNIILEELNQNDKVESGVGSLGIIQEVDIESGWVDIYWENGVFAGRVQKLDQSALEDKGIHKVGKKAQKWSDIIEGQIITISVDTVMFGSREQDLSSQTPYKQVNVPAGDYEVVRVGRDYAVILRSVGTGNIYEVFVDPTEITANRKIGQPILPEYDKEQEEDVTWEWCPKCGNRVWSDEKVCSVCGEGIELFGKRDQLEKGEIKVGDEFIADKNVFGMTTRYVITGVDYGASLISHDDLVKHNVYNVITGELLYKDKSNVLAVFNNMLKRGVLQKKAMFVNLPDIESLGGEITDRELLRLGIIAELDAVNLYEKMAKMTTNQAISDVMNNVAAEEKTHVGEFEALLKQIDMQYNTELGEGTQEVAEIVGEEIPEAL